MKIAALSVTLSALAVSVIAANAMAASPNGRVPKCPLGQIPVLENNQYHCERPSIKAQTKPAERATGGKAERATGGKKVRKRAKPKPLIIKPIKVKIKLPDLTIMSAKVKHGSADRFIVTVRNLGTAPTVVNSLLGTHHLDNNSSWSGDVLVPVLAPGAMKQVEVWIPSNSMYDLGDKITFEADWQGKILESNEKNNKFSYKYPIKNPT